MPPKDSKSGDIRVGEIPMPGRLTVALCARGVCGAAVCGVDVCCGCVAGLSVFNRGIPLSVVVLFVTASDEAALPAGAVCTGGSCAVDVLVGIGKTAPSGIATTCGVSVFVLERLS